MSQISDEQALKFKAEQDRIEAAEKFNIQQQETAFAQRRSGYIANGIVGMLFFSVCAYFLYKKEHTNWAFFALFLSFWGVGGVVYGATLPRT
jgi:hypothetical protein